MCLRCVSPSSLSCGKSCKPVYSEWPSIGSIDVVTVSQRFSIRIFFFFLITRLKEFLALDRILSWLLFVIKNKYLIFLILLQLFQTLVSGINCYILSRTQTRYLPGSNSDRMQISIN